MAALLLLSLLLTFSFPSSAARRHNPPTSATPNIVSDVCKASPDPRTCQSSLSQVPPDATVLQTIQSAIGVSFQNLESGRAMVQNILDRSTGNLNRSSAAKTYLEFLNYSAYRLRGRCSKRLMPHQIMPGRVNDS